MTKVKKFHNITATAEETKPIKNGTFHETKLNIDDTKYEPPAQLHWFFRRIFILTWIKSYDRETAIADLIAGVTLGLTIIPQSIAYAALAGISSEYGLYSAFIGSMIYVFFGTIPQVSIGPTSLMALMVLQFCSDKPIQIVIVLSFLAGLVEFLMGVFQLGFIVSFIPYSVNKAFTTATAIYVALVQVKNLLGIRVKGFTSMVKMWQSISPADASLGIICLVVLLSLKKLNDVNFTKNTDAKRRLKKLLWYISISRNALVVFFCALIAYIWIQERSYEAMPFALSANVESAAITVKLPPFAFEHNNVTYTFTDICRELGSGIIVVPIVAVLANVAIAKAFVKDGNLDASQEMLTLGLCNLAGSFFSAMPTCGAFTRSAVSHSSGVRTPMAGIYTGILVLLALSILTPYIRYIPKSSLAAVLIVAVIFMADFKPFKELWRTNKKDFFTWCICIVVCLIFGVEIGLFLGIIIYLVFMLYSLGSPTFDIKLKEIDNVGYLHMIPLSDVYYSGVELLRTKIRGACSMYRYDFPVVLDCSRFMLFDATFIDMIKPIAKELSEKNVLFILHNMNEEVKKLISVETTNLRFCDGVLTANHILSANL